MKQNENTSRRNFLKNTSLIGVSALTIPQLVSTSFAKESRKRFKISKDDIILLRRKYNLSIPDEENFASGSSHDSYRHCGFLHDL